ncbi:MAG: HAD family phosphatase [Chloroflexi bacterium]|nr:HAD family phosphatase [Chloroflexota bacterium]
MTLNVFAFDCGGVVLHETDCSPYERWAGRLGLSADELRQRLWAGDLWSQAERGQISDAAFWRRTGQELGLSERDARTLREDLWRRWQPDATVLSFIERVRTRYRVAMISNATDALEGELARRYGLADRFETIVNSARVGVAKPDSGIYAELLRRLQVEASEVVLVDDRAENVAAAAALGMHVLWFVSPQEFARQLQAYLRPRMAERLVTGVG